VHQIQQQNRLTELIPAVNVNHQPQPNPPQQTNAGGRRQQGRNAGGNAAALRAIKNELKAEQGD